MDTVIFRKWTARGMGGDVFAIFPYDAAAYGDGSVTTYGHVGQHAAGMYANMVARSRLARPDEYEELRQELVKVGYDLAIRKRASFAAMRAAQREARHG